MIRVSFKLFISFLFLTGCGWLFAQADSLPDDEAAITANIKALHSVNNEVRAKAAEALRRIVAKYPSGTSNIRSKDGGEADWMKKVGQVVPGMTAFEVSQILPPFADAPDGMSIGSGQSHITDYRLDFHWVVSIQFRNPDAVIEPPKLNKREMLVNVAAPKNYTGSWICWYVNGQKGLETQFIDGKYDGVFTNFHDNGKKAVEQHYVNYVAEGADTGWYPDGKIMYTGLYRSGKTDGQWVHWYPNGNKSSGMNFKNGVFDGLHAGGMKMVRCDSR